MTMTIKMCTFKNSQISRLAFLHPDIPGVSHLNSGHSPLRTRKKYNRHCSWRSTFTFVCLVLLAVYLEVVEAELLTWKLEDNCFELRPDSVTSVSCTGENITRIPQNLSPNITRLLLSNSAMQVLPSQSFSVYRALTYIEIRNFSRLKTIQPDAFQGVYALHHLFIINCISLETIGPGVFGHFQSLDTLHVTASSLTEVPDFSNFGTSSSSLNNAMYEIDLSANKIRSVKAAAFQNIKTHILRLENNLLAKIEDHAFYGALIQKIFVKNNFLLEQIGESAFSRIDGLQFLDLSRSKITHLPTEGLVNIRELVLEETYSLKQFPSVFKFSLIDTARLTYEHHCCAFRHADKQDPVASIHMMGLSSFCTTQMNHVAGQPEFRRLIDSMSDFRVKRASEGMFMSSVRSLMSFGWQTIGLGGVSGSIKSQRQDLDDSQYGSIVEVNDRRDVSHGFFMQSSSDRKEQQQSSHTTGASATTTPAMKHSDSFGQFILASTVSTTTFHRSVTASTLWHETRSPDDKDKWVGCGNFSLPKDYKGVVCTPQPNAFNPCEDVMGYEWLRVFVWFVLLAALCGNFIVIIVLITARSKLTVPKFLMCNLSFADFLMGFYLLLIASVDIHSLGEYFTYAVSWQNDGGCQVAGFLTVFSSELSVFVLTVITMERWYAISQAIHVNKRLRMRQAMSLIFVGWVFASILAILPLIGVSSYGAVSMCLPMEAKDVVDTTYIISLLLFNGVAFVIICGCYVSMFLKVRASENMSRSNDATIAKRMAVLVLTNFICWAPIAFFGFTASFGLPLIDITNSKILLVFFYPFNSCANPFLYAILTKQFRKDLFILLGRYGFCTNRANKYKGTSITRSYSNSRHNGLQLNVTHNHTTDISILSQHRKSSRGSALSQNGTPPQSSRGSFPKTTPQETPQETPTTSPKTVNSPSKDGPARQFFSNLTELKTVINERKLSTVIETIHTSDGLTDDGGACALITASNKCEERVLEARDSLRDLFDGNPHGRVRSASEYVVIFKTSSPGQQQLEPQCRRGSRRSNPFERQTSKDTVISSNTLSSYISDMSSSRFDSDFDSRSVDRRLSPASFQMPSNFEKRDSGFSDMSQENTYTKCRNRSSKLKDIENISETENLLHKPDSNVSERQHNICDNIQRVANFKDASNILSVDSIDEEETDNTGNIQYDKINAKTSRKLYERTAVLLTQDPDDYSNSDDTDDDLKARQFLLFKR